jgi:hypothetical protein
MLALSPITHFQKTRATDAEELFKAVRTVWMTSALTHALAEMSGRNATNDELRGARIFIGILLNMAEPIPAPAPPLPDKSLGQKRAEPQKE